LSLSSSSWVVIHVPVPVSTPRALRVLAAGVGGAEGGSRHGGGGLVPRCLSPLPSLMPRSSPPSFRGRLHPRTSLCPASRCSQRRCWVLGAGSCCPVSVVLGCRAFMIVVLSSPSASLLPSSPCSCWLSSSSLLSSPSSWSSS
jgi:hypothetical protein